MKNWNWSKIIMAILSLVGAITGGTYALEASGVIAITPATPQEIALGNVPGTVATYYVDVQVVWKATPNATPQAQYLLATHKITMQTVPNVATSFAEVKKLFVNGKIKAPVDDFVPVYAYTAEVTKRVGIPLAEDGEVPEGADDGK